MSTWRMTPLNARFTAEIPSGVDVRVSELDRCDFTVGRFPALELYSLGQAVPETAVVPVALSTADDLAHLADAAEEWARHLREAARVRRDQEDSQPYRSAG